MSKVNPEAHGYKPAPNIMKEYDEWTPGWLDSDDFKMYCDEVHLAIQSIGIATVASIRRRVVRQNAQGYLADALSHLISISAIRDRNTISRTTYEIRETLTPVQPKPKKTWTGFNNEKAPPVKKPDGLVLFGDKSIF